ncbi:MAG: hypothetical protein VX463_19145 [Pseudomonadota bacterium]|nr:hypothetical protein [Pseudomonadota bacterium]
MGLGAKSKAMRPNELDAGISPLAGRGCVQHSVHQIKPDMLRNFLLGFLFSLFIGAGAAQAASYWTNISDLDSRDGDGMYCSAGTSWRDSSTFVLEFREGLGHRFMLSSPGWDLPLDQAGTLRFDFGRGRVYAFDVESFDRRTVGGLLIGDDVRSVIRLFGDGRQMRIRFPKGDDWIVGLRGSKASLAEWLDCVTRMKSIARTGAPAGINPFGKAGSAEPF